MICIRQVAQGLDLFYAKDKMPPMEKVGDKRLNITEAIEMGMDETHHRLGLFTTDELIVLRDSINQVLILEGKYE